MIVPCVSPLWSCPLLQDASAPLSPTWGFSGYHTYQVPFNRFTSRLRVPHTPGFDRKCIRAFFLGTKPNWVCWKSYFVTNIHCHLHLLSLFVRRVSLHKHGQFFVCSRTLFTSVFCTNTEVRHLVTFFYLVLTYYLVCLWARLVNTHSVLHQHWVCLWARLVVRANLTKGFSI